VVIFFLESKEGISRFLSTCLQSRIYDVISLTTQENLREEQKTIATVGVAQDEDYYGVRSKSNLRKIGE